MEANDSPEIPDSEEGEDIRYPWPPFEVRQKEGQSGRRGGAHLGKRVGVEALFRKCI